jgi:hypothetical protein
VLLQRKESIVFGQTDQLSSSQQRNFTVLNHTGQLSFTQQKDSKVLSQRVGQLFSMLTEGCDVLSSIKWSTILNSTKGLFCPQSIKAVKRHRPPVCLKIQLILLHPEEISYTTSKRRTLLTLYDITHYKKNTL